MSSSIIVVFVLLIFFVTIGDGSKKSIHKIIIHVPYKILKHHHIHTKYKVITIPEVKKENSITIYKQPEYQPQIKYSYKLYPQPQVELKDNHKGFTSHHHSDSISDTTTSENQQDIKVTEFLQYPATHIELKDEKAFEQLLDDAASKSEPYMKVQKYSQNLKPVNLHSSENSISEMGYTSNLFFKPSMPVLHGGFSPTFYLKINSPPYNFFPKFSSYKTMLKNFNPHIIAPPKFFLKSRPFQSHKSMISKVPFKPHQQDNIAHSSNHFYKTIINPTLRNTGSYSVKEPSQELNPPVFKHVHKPSNIFRNNHVKYQMHSYPHKYPYSTTTKADVDPEYEHIGYLILQENSENTSDKDFKNELF